MGQSVIQRLQNSESGMAAGYDKDTQELTIVFGNGRSYVYSGVPPDEWEAMQAAPSAGRFFNERIRNVY